MKTHFPILFFLLFSLTATAQQRPILNSNYDAYTYFNPAAQSSIYLVKKADYHMFSAFYAAQGEKFKGRVIDGRPAIVGINYNGVWRARNSIGGSLTYREIGAIKQTQVQLRFGRQLLPQRIYFSDNFGKKPAPSLFLAGGLQGNWLKIDFTRMTGYDQNDPVVLNSVNLRARDFTLNASFGLFVRWPVGKRAFLIGGLSAIQAVEFTRFNNQPLQTAQHYFGNIGCIYKMTAKAYSNRYDYLDVGIMRTQYSFNAFTNFEEKSVPVDYTVHVRVHLDYTSDNMITFGGSYVHGRRSFQIESTFLLASGIGVGFAFDVLSFNTDLQEIFGKLNTGEVKVIYRKRTYQISSR